jgi:hypothetical protein
MFSAASSGLRIAALALLFGIGFAHAHEGHDHAGQAAPAPAHVLPRGESASPVFQTVVVARAGELTIYLDRFATNEPVADAAIEVETPDGPAPALPRPDGSYGLKAPWLPKAGHVDIALSVTAGNDVDVLSISLDIPDTSAKDAGARGGLESASNAVWLPLITLGVGLAIGLAIGPVFGPVIGRFRYRKRIAIMMLAAAIMILGNNRSIAHEGHDHGSQDAPAIAAGQGERAQRQADGTVFVPKPVQRIFSLRTLVAETGDFQRIVELPGRIVPDPNASGYVQTALGGRLSPPPGGFPRLGAVVKAGDILGYVTPPVQTIDVSDMRQRQGELDQQISIVERRLTRYEQLVVSGAVSRTQLDDTRLELQGLKDRRVSLDQVRREPEALIAPVSGVVAEGVPVSGQIAQTNGVILQIVDPQKLWVEALSFDTLNGPQTASATTAAGKSLQLAFRGAGFADRSQAIPIHFAIEGETAGTRPGQFVTVFAANGEHKTGIAVPRIAVVRAANGQEHVFEQISAERFTPRPVRTEPLDGERVLILAGVEPGRRIVVQGADLLDHVR